jgi:chromosome segregation ATPase
VSTDLNTYQANHRVNSISLSHKRKNLVADLERVQRHIEDLEQQERATYQEIDTLEQQINETNTRLKNIRGEEVELVKLRQLSAVLTDAQTDLEQAAGITTDRKLQSWITDLHRRLRVAMNIIDELTVQREQRKRMSIVAMLPKEWDKVRLFDIAEEPECPYSGADESHHVL